MLESLIREKPVKLCHKYKLVSCCGHHTLRLYMQLAVACFPTAVLAVRTRPQATGAGSLHQGQRPWCLFRCIASMCKAHVDAVQAAHISATSARQVCSCRQQQGSLLAQLVELPARGAAWRRLQQHLNSFFAIAPKFDAESSQSLLSMQSGGPHFWRPPTSCDCLRTTRLNFAHTER